MMMVTLSSRRGLIAAFRKAARFCGAAPTQTRQRSSFHAVSRANVSGSRCSNAPTTVQVGGSRQSVQKQGWSQYTRLRERSYRHDE